jgi:hypothetical protein
LKILITKKAGGVTQGEGLGFKYLKENKQTNTNSFCPVPVAHACNPRLSGGRDEEDHGLRPARAKRKKK